MTEVHERVFARIPSPEDPRDRNFPMAAPQVTRTWRTWFTSPPLDQGSTSECVAYSGAQYLMSAPVVNGPPHIPWLYTECQRNDQWEGEEPTYEGTSVRALFKVFQREGYVSGYSWSFDAATAVRHVLEVGPVVMGTTWLSGMDKPDAQGFVPASGSPRGGHAWTIYGANLNRACPDGTVGAVYAINSWGERYGRGGRFSLSIADLDKLIRDRGEACAAIEKRRL